MTNADTPDYQRGVVSAQKLLAAVGPPAATVTVTLPPNTEALWIIGAPPPDAAPTVTGVETGASYPCIPLLATVTTPVEFVPFVALVSPDVDAQVVVNVGSATTATWYVVADTGGRFTLDVLLADAMTSNFQPSPGLALQVAGWDGTDLHILLTDSTGALVTSGSTFPPVYAARGAALPADALLVGGSDGTDLRAILTDTAGHLLTLDQTLKLVVAALNAATPADAVLVAGSDGTDLRALLTDNTGKLQVAGATFPAVFGANGVANPANALIVAGTDGTDLRYLVTTPLNRLLVSDEKLDASIGLPAAAFPTDVVQIGGNDGFDLRALLLNTKGMPWAIPTVPNPFTGDHPPNEIQWASNSTGAGTVAVVAAPGAGKRIRVFYGAFWPDNAACSGYLLAASVAGSATYLSVGITPAGVTPSPAALPLTGMACDANTAVNLTVTAGIAIATVGYTIETI